MDCEEVARNLSDALDGEVSSWRRLQIRVHQICPPCRQVQRALARTVELLGGLPDVPDPDLLGDEEPAGDEPG